MSKEKELVCKECGNNSFQFKWIIKNRKHELALLYCHEGMCYQFQDSIIKCPKCAIKSEYELEDFLKVQEAKK